MVAVEGGRYLLESQLCKALGLDAGDIHRLTLTFQGGEVAQAEVVLFPNKEVLNNLEPIIKQYKLVPKFEVGEYGE